MLERAARRETRGAYRAGGARALMWEERLKWPVVAAAVLAVPSVFLGVSPVPEPWPAVGLALHWLVWLVFASEVVIMLVVSDDPVTWARTHRFALFVVLVSSPLLPALVALTQTVRGLVAVKVLKLAKAAKLAKGAKATKATRVSQLPEAIGLVKRLARLGRLRKAVKVLRARLLLRGLRLGFVMASVSLVALASVVLLASDSAYGRLFPDPDAVVGAAPDRGAVGWILAAVLVLAVVALAIGLRARRTPPAGAARPRGDVSGGRPGAG